MTVPECWDACSAVLRDGMVDMSVEATVSAAPPLIVTPYTTEAFICPHGVRYWLEPTSEQVAQWTADGVE